MSTIQKVLFVDDEPDIRRIGQLSLERVGKWSVTLVESGHDALEAAAREHPDLVILDVMMPELDGPGTLARLRAQESTSTIPVIFMTARVQNHEVDRYMKLGAKGVIRKPFDPLTLPSQIRSIVEGR